MNNMTRKTKWTKKLKAIVISVGLAFAVALGGACAAIGVSLADNNRRLDGSFAGGVADDNTPKVPTAEETFYAGATVGETTYATSAEAWEAAVSYSLTHEGAPVEFRLDRSWVANAATGFGAAITAEDGALSENSPFGLAGSLNVPVKAQIILNINEYVVLHRNLEDAAGAETSNAIENGEVITVSGGTLYLVGGGTITCGNTLGNGGGVNVNGGSLTIVDGTISNNKSGVAGGGIYANNSATVALSGGIISNNTSVRGGGILTENSDFIMSGSTEVCNNNAIRREVNGSPDGGFGGGMYLYGGANTTKLIISGGKIYNNTAEVNSGAMSFQGYNFTDNKKTVLEMTGGEIYGNTSSNWGGICVNTYAKMVMSGGKIYKNTATAGVAGAIYVAGVFEMSGGEINENTANTGGGGIYAVPGSTLEMTGGEISGNTLTSKAINSLALTGGAGVCLFSTFTMSGGTISNNTGTWWGGGVYVAPNATFNMTSGIISKNQGMYGAGVMVNTLGEMTLSGDALITENYATDGGAGICLNGDRVAECGDSEEIIGGKLTMSGGVVSDNSANNSGGGIWYESNSEITMTAGVIKNNTAGAHGGAIVNTYSRGNAKLDISGGEIYGNTAHGTGGAIYIGNGVSADEYRDVSIKNIVIRDNFANGNGGAIWSGVYINLSISGVTMQNNYAAGNASAIFQSSNSTVTVEHTRFFDNEALGLGVHFISSGSKTSWTDVTAQRNIGKEGVVYLCDNELPLELTDVNITNNTAGLYGGGIIACVGHTKIWLNGKIEVFDNTCGGGIDENGKAYGKVSNIMNASSITLFKLSEKAGAAITAGSRIGVNSYTPVANESTCVIFEGKKPDTLEIFADNPDYYDVQSTDTDTRLIVKNSVTTKTNAQRWSEAVALSQNSKKQVVFELLENWAEDSSHNFGSGTGFIDGRLHVPSDADIVLDMHNYAITRNIAANTTWDRSIIKVEGNLTLVGNGRITGGKVNGGGGAIWVVSGTFNLYSNSIYGHSTTGAGGGAILVQGGTFNMYGGNMYSNTAPYGGAVYVTGGTFNMYGGLIYSNTASNDGGGVYINGTGSFNMKGGAIYSNGATAYGGGIVVNTTSANCSISGGFIHDNSVRTIANNVTTYAGYGGGISIGKTTTLRLSGGYIYNNHSENGAGVFAHDDTSTGGKLIMSGGEIYSNTAEVDGGGVLVCPVNTNKASMVLTGGKIYKNTAKRSGGGICAYGNLTIGTVTGSGANAVYSGEGEIYQNTASHGGGVLGMATINLYGGEIYNNTVDHISGENGTHLGGGVAVWTSCTFKMYGGEIYGNKIRTDNANATSKNDWGGGVQVDSNGVFDMYGGKIRENSASLGAGVYVGGVSGSTAVMNLRGGSILNNAATNQGGGVYITTGCKLNIYDGLLSGNTASSLGGALLLNGATVTMSGGEICNNTTNGGGGAYLYNDSLFTMTGGSIHSNHANMRGGALDVGSSLSTAVLTGGKIYNNTAVLGGAATSNGNMKKITVGGNIEIYNNVNTGTVTGGGAFYTGGTPSVFEITGNASIHHNSSYNGGVVWVDAGATLNISGGKIYANTAKNHGGVVYLANGKVNISGGTFGGESRADGNIAGGNGGVIYNATDTNSGSNLDNLNITTGTFINNYAHSNGGVIFGNDTIKGTLINGEYSVKLLNNRAEIGNGGAICTNGITNVDTALIQGNYSGNVGGGMSIRYGVYKNVMICDNYAVYYGGGVNSCNDMEFIDCSIINNTAGLGAGGVYISSTFKVSGATVVDDNHLSDGTLNNVWVTDRVITVSGALSQNAHIGVTAENGVAFTTGFAASSGLAHPNLAFYADNDKKVVGKTSAGEAVLVDAVKVNINVYDKGGNNVTEQKFVKVDVGSSITYESAADSVTFNTVQGGGNIKMKVDVPEVKGYTPFLYDPVSGKRINNGDALITNMDGGSNREASLDVKYEPNTDTPYTVYYILQLPEANSYTDRNGYLKTRDLSELTRSPSVRIFRSTGTTDTEFAYINGETALADWSERQYYSFYDVEGTPNIDGDGNGHVIVLLKLNEYTVTYNGNGGTPSRQTKIFKYGATLTAPTRTPTKRMTTFMGWYDSNGVQVIDEKGKLVSTYSPSTVSADMTLTARYNATTYHIRFDMNIDTGEDYSIDPQYALQMETDSTTLDGTNGFVAWDTDRLFPEADGFNYQGSNNVFTIDYTIENIPYTMSIRNVRPTAVGYTFAGWYRENDDGSTSRVDTIAPPTSNTSDKFPIIYRAHWNPTSYTVRFDTQDGNAVSNATVQNLCTLEKLLGDGISNGIAPTPVRAGYKFGGWYVDSDTTVSVMDACVNTDGLFSVAALGRWYRVNDNQYEHDFSNLTLYARWISEDLFVHHATNANGNPTFHVAHNGCENEFGDAFQDTDITIGDYDLLNAVHIGDTITVTPNPATGYKFDHLVIETANGSSHQLSGETSFVISNSYVTDLPDGEHKGVHVSVVYTEDRFTITYDLNGGRLEGQANYTRSYSPSELNEGHSNRTRLPNNLVREGYTFLGWTFADGDSNDDNNQIAFVSDHGVDTTENMFGKNIYMVAPTVENKVVYSNVTLKAKWEAQEAKVNLYNATYTTTDYDGMKDEDGNSVEGGYVITEAEDHINKLKTDMKIEILNPSRTSYDFLGWATSRNGAVVYPVVSGKDTISYTVHAENDVSGRPLNLNNLYAIWHIKGVDRIIMTVDNNGATYGGTITMTAQTAQTYIPAEAGGQINITYKWYLIADGMYDACFTEGQVFIDLVDGKEKVTGYEFGGVFYGEDGKTVQATQPSGDAFPYRRFDEARSVEAGYCVLKATDTKSQGEASSLARTLVNDCGNYVCVVTVTGVEDSGSTTTAGGYGEIEISMNKAVYGNLLLESKEVPYNSEALWGEIRLSFAKSGDGASISEDRTVITLPDGSKVVATYRYFTGTGVNRREITDLNEIRNVGTYYVTVEFAWAADGDNGNYEPLEAIETELVITPYEISSIGFKFVHGDDSTIPQTFTGVYDGTAYGVTASINDTFGLDGAHVAQVDDIELIVSINTVTANGADQPFTGDTTVNAGTYSLVVSTTLGGDAEAVKNYVLKRGITLRQVYTITKSSYAVKGNIAFEDKTVEFDNLDHTIEVEVLNGMTLPDTVTPTYRLVDYARENEKYVYNPSGNVGNDAGVYTVEVVFNDTNSANYEQLETMTATLTITKANLFDYFANKRAETVDLLGEADFVGRTFKFDASLESKPYKPVVKTGSRLANTSIFTITYKYYLVGEDGTRTEKPDGFFEAGRYEIVADIKYADERYKNDFEEVQENESTIVYVIEDVDVKEVIVHFTQAFENSGKLALLNGTFDYSWIRQIDVVYAYEDVDGSTVTSTRYINQEEDIRMAEIKYGDDTHTSFWKVGEFKMTVGVYGSDCEVTVNVKQEIDVTDGSNFSVEYNTGNEWKRVGDDGYDGVQLESGSYQFRVSFNAVGTDGAVNIVSCGVSTVGNAALKLGENELAINTGDTNSVNYIFNGKIAVNMYKVITSAEETLKWQYSADGGRNWRDFEQDGDGNYIYSMPYIGSEYLIRVTFMDGGVLQSCKAYAFDNATQRRLTVQNCIDGGYEMYVGLDGNYLLDESVTCGMSVAPRVLEVTWDRESFIYNGNYQAPVITSDNIAAVDKGLITFDYQLFEYDEDAENHMGAQTSEADVFDANKYVIAVVLRGEESVIANYTTDNSATAVKTFTIEKAKAAVSVTYNEHNYGTNVTFAGNAHGLRTDALRASFTGTTVEGRLVFVNGTDPQTGKPIEINGNDDIIKNLIRNAGNPYVSYAFIPDDDKNYDVTYGRLMLTVNAQTPKRGTDSLLIELGEGAIKHYLVNQNFNTKGINVYRMYESYYTEGNNWYGYRGEPITTNLNLRINGAAANGHTITKEEVSGGTIVLTAIVGTDRGTLNIPVEEKKAVKLEISSEDYKTVFYVGETFDFSNMQFTVTYDDETIQEGLTRGSVTCDYDNYVFENAGTFEVTFSYFDAVCTMNVEVKAKEDLTIVEFSDSDKLLVYNDGNPIDIPVLKFLIDGNTIGDDRYEEYGIKVTRTILRNNSQLNEITEVGRYQIRYSVDVSGNPRFNRPAPIVITVEVTLNRYKVTIGKPAAESLIAVYTGSGIEIPDPEEIKAIDAKTGLDVTPTSVRYYIDGTEIINDYGWIKDKAGTYTVTVVVTVDDEETRAEYEFEIMQAKNGNLFVETHTVVLKEGETFPVFPVTADFGASTAVIKYSKDRNAADADWTTEAPATAGVWYVKVTIDGTDDYTGVSIIEPFEVRTNGANASTGDGLVEGSIKGENGVGTDWSLEIRQLDSETVSEVSIDKQNVLDGYEVIFKAGSAPVKDEGEYTVRIKLTDELKGRKDLNVYFVDAEGNKTKLNASVEGDFIEVKMSSFDGSVIITNAVPGEPIGLLVALIVLGVIAAGMIAACIIVFVKKKKRGAE